MRRALGLTFAIVLCVGSIASATELVIFYEDGCPHCTRIESFLESIAPDYPTLEVTRYEIHDPEAHDLLPQLLAAYGAELGPVPIIFIGDVAMVGGTFYGPYPEPTTLTGRAEQMELEKAIERAIADDAPSPLSRTEGTSGSGLAKSLTIPAVVLAAAADSVNPCTFAVLVLLLGTLLVAGKKGKVLQAGLAFIAAIYISYFLMGIGIFSAIQAAGVQRPFIIAVSGLAILLGLWNMKDYFAYGKWFTIEVPARWRPLVKRITSSVVSVPGAFAVGVLDSLFLLPCSSGPYIAILALLSKTTTRAQGVGLLLFYNLIFILPLLIITVAVHFGYTTTARAERWRSARLGKLHLVSGVVMLLLGVGMIVATELGIM
ncbi:MAG TPA: cytochrome c biogenesis protein [Candidatus Acetothermia bacterium]|nr:cytochrome c biogenesis protein [Candidatus Acetothermia bacterium]